jgi:hypothetical protein
MGDLCQVDGEITPDLGPGTEPDSSLLDLGVKNI